MVDRRPFASWVRKFTQAQQLFKRAAPLSSIVLQAGRGGTTPRNEILENSVGFCNGVLQGPRVDRIVAQNGDQYPHDETAEKRESRYTEAVMLTPEGLVKLGNRMNESDYQMRKAQYERDSYLAELIELR